MILVLALVMVVWVSPAHATRYWVSPSGSDANSCSAVSGALDPGVYRATVAGGKACLVGGDTLTLKAGVYNGPSANIGPSLPSGTLGAETIVEGDPSSPPQCALNSNCPTILRLSGDNGHYISGNYWIVRKLDIDAVNAGKGFYPIAPWKPCSNVLIEDVESHNTLTSTGSVNTASGAGSHAECNFVTFRRVHVHTNGDTISGAGHGMYLSSKDLTLEDSVIHDNQSMGLQCYSSSTVPGFTSADRCHLLRNRVYNNRHNGMVIEGDDGVAIGNVIYNNGTNGIVSGFSTAKRQRILNNTIVNNDTRGLGASGITVGYNANTDDTLVQNNIIFGHATAIYIDNSAPGLVISYNACESAKSCGTTGKLSLAALTDILVSGSDYRLKEGSAAINAGTAVSGYAYNGSAPDMGAYETFTLGSAVIAGTTAEVTAAMNLNTPILPTTAGWSLSCIPNPTACPSTTITAAVLKPGTSGTVQLTYNGAACEAGQIWTYTYAASTGNTTDSFTTMSKQEATSTTAHAITNNCTGGGGPPPPPSGLYVHYTLDEGTGTTADDETANNLDGTLTNGAGWAEGLNGNGLALTTGTNQYLAIPYGTAVNPSTQSLTVAFWVKVPANPNGIYFGAPIGSNQRFYVGIGNNLWGIGIQSTGGGTPSEFTAQPGQWTHVCVTMDSSTDTATLAINGVSGASAGSVKPYTSYSFAGNFRVGYVDNNLTPGGVFDEVKMWTEVVSCLDDYQAANPSSSPWAGTLSIVATRFYGAKTDSLNAVVPLGANDAVITLPAGAAFAYASQTDCTVSECTPIAERLYYTCASCPSAGADLPVPDSPSADGISFWGTANEVGLLSGSHGTNLSGVLAHIDGGTGKLSDSVPVFDLALNTSTVIRALLRIAQGTPQGRTYCFKPREQTGVALNSYTPPGGLCITVGPAVAISGF